MRANFCRHNYIAVQGLRELDGGALLVADTPSASATTDANTGVLISFERSAWADFLWKSVKNH